MRKELRTECGDDRLNGIVQARMARGDHTKSKPCAALELAAVLRRELGALSREDSAVAQVIANFELLLRQLESISATRVRTRITNKSKPAQLGSRGQTLPSILSSAVDLRRACRIALMEVNIAVSTQDIHDRIVRRGSFTFEGSKKDVMALIDRTLQSMCDDREVTVQPGEPRLWTRTDIEKSAPAR